MDHGLNIIMEIMFCRNCTFEGLHLKTKQSILHVLISIVEPCTSEGRGDFHALDHMQYLMKGIIFVSSRQRVSNPNFHTKLILGQVLLPLSYSASPINIGSMNCLYVYVNTDLML